MQPMTVGDAAAKLGVTTGRVRQLIGAGSLKATKYGRDWLIDPRDLRRLVRIPVGRPKLV